MNRIRGLNSSEKLPQCHQVTMVAPLLTAFASGSVVGWPPPLILYYHHHLRKPFLHRLLKLEFLEFQLHFIPNLKQSYWPGTQISKLLPCIRAESIANNKQLFWSFGAHSRQRSPIILLRNNFWGLAPIDYFDIDSLLEIGFS